MCVYMYVTASALYRKQRTQSRFTPLDLCFYTTDLRCAGMQYRLIAEWSCTQLFALANKYYYRACKTRFHHTDKHHCSPVPVPRLFHFFCPSLSLFVNAQHACWRLRQRARCLNRQQLHPQLPTATLTHKGQQKTFHAICRLLLGSITRRLRTIIQWSVKERATPYAALELSAYIHPFFTRSGNQLIIHNITPSSCG